MKNGRSIGEKKRGGKGKKVKKLKFEKHYIA